MKLHAHRRFPTLLGVACLALGAALAPVLAGPADGSMGHRFGGDFDLAAAVAERQALVDRLNNVLPRGARENPILVPVSDAERNEITLSTETALRIGVVKPLASAVVFKGSGLTARAEHAGRFAGVLEPTPNGGYVWATTIESPEATALRLHFTDVDLAPGVEVYLLTERGEAFGPYTGGGLLDTGEFWSHTVAGSRVTVQLVQPGTDAAGAPSTFAIRDLGYVDLTKVPGMPTIDPEAGEQLCSFNAPCTENANCGGLNIPAAVQTARDAYAHMEYVQGAFLYYCTGGLMATTPSTGTPYFLTANHCISSSSVANSLQAFFQYEIGCNGTCPALYFYNQTPPPFPRTVGATLRATSGTSDYTLLQLSQAAPAGSAFLGWTTTAVANSNGTALYRISHPGGAPQAYSAHQVSTSAPTCNGIPRGAWIYSRDTLGATEGGSSGSPVLNVSGQVVGQLTGACGTNVNDECDAVNNATIDGAFANYYCGVQPFLNPSDTSCGGGGGCSPAGATCTANSECCSNSCKGKPGAKKCK